MAELCEEFDAYQILSVIGDKRYKKRPNNIALLGLLIWWLEAESNCRHADFQSAALPTELSSRKK